MYIYVLKLKGEKYYVGKTKNLESRLRQHKTGYGSKWTQKYGFCKCIKKIQEQRLSDEDAVTIDYMSRYGINNVRGGSFSKFVLEPHLRIAAKQMIKSIKNKCNRCGEKGHYVEQCNNEPDHYLNKIYDLFKN